tara:strand:- start:20406 stop:21626 length:1221 start_codon:yes stop_codon:yes gene_type:complete
MNKVISAAGFAVAINLTLTGSAFAQEAPMSEIWQMLQDQQQEIAALKEQLEQNNTQIQQTQVMAVSVADAIETQSAGSSSPSWADKTAIGGYGEHHYNNVDGGRDQVDAHRYVLYVSHDYSDSIRFFSEWELEHSLAGDGKPGEVELEQAYIEWQFDPNHRATFGQYLVPVGILNETHEPDTFYGVERNKVESEVVPSTWWETGAMLSGNLAQGLSYDLAIHGGLNMSDDEDALKTFRIRSSRQKSAEANANNLAYTGRLSYTGTPGLAMSVSLQHQTDLLQSMVVGDEAPATLLSAHLIYQVEKFSVRALYAAWDIDNASFEANGSADPSGWYVEPSYKLSDKFGVFARYSEVDPRRGDKPTEVTERVDYGFNYWLTPQVAIKADYQNDRQDGNDAINIGIGWSY